MRCNICDKAMSDSEIIFNKDLNGYEPCVVCLEIAMDAAFSQGIQKQDEFEIPEEIGDEFGDGIVETFDSDTHYSNYQLGDATDTPEREYEYE